MIILKKCKPKCETLSDCHAPEEVKSVKSYEVIGYTADADVWCPGCFKAAGYEDEGEDSEGNPTHPIFAGDEGAEDEVCNDCKGRLL